MDILDRLLGHDAWTTRQLLLRARELTDEQLDQPFDIGDRSLRETFDHLIGCMERHTDFMLERRPPASPDRTDTTVAGLLRRQTEISKDFADIALRTQRHDRADALVKHPEHGRRRPLGALAAHLITHSMHHRAQILYIFEKLGVAEVIEGDALAWESVSRGLGWEDCASYGTPVVG